MKVKSEYMVKLQGKDFVLYAGLLHAAHEQDLNGIKTEVLQFPTKENPLAVCRAEVSIGGQIFTGIGDASPDSVNRMMAPHIVRMAETRAKARALRDALDVGECSVEELGDDISDTKPQGQSPKHNTEKQALDEFGGNAFNAKRDERPISVNQAKRMFAISKGNEALVRSVLTKYDYQHSKDVLRSDYDAICQEIEAMAELGGISNVP